MEPYTVVICDTETTGIDVAASGVCQVAAVAVYEESGTLHVQPLHQTYCRPSFPMTDGAFKVHGIGPEKYEYAPTDQTAIWGMGEIVRGIGDNTFLAGYNSDRFDYPLMHNLQPAAAFNAMAKFDVMTMVLRQDKGESFKLVEVFARMYGSDHPLLSSAHDAMADCWMTAYVLIQLMKDRNSTDFQALYDEMNQPKLLTRMPFGKYKGKLFSEVPRSYLTWAAGKWVDMSPDMAYTFRNLGLLK